MSDSYDNPALVEKVCRMICSGRGQDADAMVFPKDWVFYQPHESYSEMPTNLPLQPLWQTFKSDAEYAIAAVRNWDFKQSPPRVAS